MSAQILEFKRKDPDWKNIYQNMEKIDLMMEMGHFTHFLTNRGILTQKLAERGLELYKALYEVASTIEFKNAVQQNVLKLTQELETNKVSKHLPRV